MGNINRDITIVKASAGTGKTYRLALEYISRLVLGEDYNEILFMTFTRAATAELKERIFEFLDDLSNGDKELEKNIKSLYPKIVINQEKIKEIKSKLLQNKDKIRISTIDSFIGQIFKKAIGPSLNIYNYSMSNMVEAEEVYGEVFSKMISGRSFEEIKGFLEQTADREVEKYIRVIKKISDERWKFSLLEEKAEITDVESMKSELYKDIVRTFELVEELVEVHGKIRGSVIAKIGKVIEERFKGELGRKGEVIELVMDNANEFLLKRIINGKQMGGKVREYIKEEALQIQENIHRLISKIIFVEEILPYEKEILKIEKLTRSIYDNIKFKQKKLTFSDITNYTSEYLDKKDLDLVKGGEVTENFCEIIGGKITTLFLDEAQDTSVAQWKVIEPIAKSCKNIIIVGDEKQSIYSWRGGDKGLFLNFSKMLDGKEDTLGTNYRSEKKIIDFVNIFFSSVSKNYTSNQEDNDEVQWEYKEVKCSKKGDKGFVGVMVDPDLYQGIAVDIKERFTKIRKGRSINYQGIGVVAKTKKELEAVGRNLKKLGVPYIMENSLSILNHPCIEEVMRLFNYFVHNDFISLVEFFRVTLNLGEEDLKYLLKNKELINKYMLDKNKTLDEKEIKDVKQEEEKEKEESEDIRGSIKIELDKIKRLRGLKYKEVGKKVMEEYNFILKYSPSRDLKNIHYFLELMDEAYDIANFIKFVENNSENLKQIGIGEINSVILMTIHGSKGLDFHTEYMILKDKEKAYELTGYENNMTTHQVRLLSKLDENYERVEDYLFTNSKYSSSIKNTDIYKYSEQVFHDEAINSIYVALTRPKANLLVFILPSEKTYKGEKSYVLNNDLFITPIEKFFDVKREELVEGGMQMVGKFIPFEESSKEEETKVELLEVDPAVYRKYFLDGEKYKKVEKNHEILDEKVKYGEIEMDVEKELKRKAGLAIHYYLENIEYGSKGEMKVAKQLTLNKYSNMLGIEKVGEIISKIEKFVKREKDIFNEELSVYRELELITYEKDSETGIEKRRVHIIDRVNIDEKNKLITIYDYKSGVSMEQEQLDRYKGVIEEKIGKEYKIKTKFLKLSQN